jgi:hypothetical protein
LQEYEDEYHGRVEEDDIENKLALRQGSNGFYTAQHRTGITQA